MFTDRVGGSGKQRVCMRVSSHPAGTKGAGLSSQSSGAAIVTPPNYQKKKGGQLGF